MSVIQINYAHEHEFFPTPSIFVDLPDCDEAVANEIVGHAIADVGLWEKPEALAMCIVLEAVEVSDHATISPLRDGDPSLIVLVNQRMVTLPLMNRPLSDGYTLTYSAFITLVRAEIEISPTSIARTLAEEANGGS